MKDALLPAAATLQIPKLRPPLNGRDGLWINSDRIHCGSPNMTAFPSQDGSRPFIPGLAWVRYDFVMNSLRPPALLACVALLAAAAAPAWAQQGRNSDQGQQPSRIERPQPPEMGERSNPRTMSESVRWAQRTTGGQVLGAERVQSDGQDFNRVKLIDDRGRVRYVDDMRQQRHRQDMPQAAPRTPRSPGF